jgi:hypothetical protein
VKETRSVFLARIEQAACARFCCDAEEKRTLLCDRYCHWHLHSALATPRRQWQT